MSGPGLFDPGAQPERTLLAWGRTCLALVVLLGLVIKVLAVGSKTALVVLTVFGLTLPGLAWLLASARYRRMQRELTRPDTPTLPPGGTAVFLATAATVLCGVLALVLVAR